MLNFLTQMAARFLFGKVIGEIIKILLVLPKTVQSVLPEKDKNGKFIHPFPEPNVGELTAGIYKKLPNRIKEEHGGTVALSECKNLSYHAAKTFQYAFALFN